MVDGRSLTVAGIRSAAFRTRPIELAVTGRERARRSQEFADRTAGERPLYGRSTGVGANRTVSVPGDSGDHAVRLLRSHAASTGERRSPERVRAMLVVRLNQLATGGSGVDPQVLDGLVAMIADDALPAVRELGSIGTGDLSALATTALALMGEGPTSSPVRHITGFGPADGLAFISSNAAVIADAALAVSSIQESAAAALVVAALTFHAVDGNAEAYSDGALRTTPFAGAADAARTMRSLIGADPFGSRRSGPSGRAAARIQDPFGLRAIPQVNGPVLDRVAEAAEVVSRLANAPTENPLVAVDDADPTGGVVAHHAGFHQAYLQMALDSLALAVAQSGQLVLARMATLIEPSFTGLPPFLGDGTPGASGVMVCEYVAASALGAMRAAAAPAGLQTVTLSRGVEEDASFASLAATQCLTIADRYRQLVACELVTAVRALRMLDRPPAGRIEEILARCAALPTDLRDRDLTEDLALAIDLLPALAELTGRPAPARS
ncbi:histidine ammonia-lyase [Nakamurella panacisegetis]|uniref:Histidine ammonia-lyase n=1 Tax=Nakamurella panacisegetis TaxID=1090615 RepID=A0A1H0NWL5_9ACTN|nr:histidine ammonia-lyase [Nakamurella panacisegetis]